MTEGILNYDCELFMEHRGSYTCRKHVICVDLQRKLARSAIHTSKHDTINMICQEALTHSIRPGL